jgi:hypothetical protein
MSRDRETAVGRPWRLLGVALLAAGLSVPSAGGATAHQTAVNNGVAVTVHVAPDDEPIANQPAAILVEKVKTRTGKFAWANCRCVIVVSDSAKNVLLKGPAKPHNDFVFPEPAAYSIGFSGRVKRNGVWRTFKVEFAIRAY